MMTFDGRPPQPREPIEVAGELVRRGGRVDVEAARVIRDLAAEIEGLRAIVDKLPTTADGVPVVPGMRVWLRTRTTPKQNTVRDVGTGYIELREDPKGCYLDKWYSTRQAADAAGEE